MKVYFSTEEEIQALARASGEPLPDLEEDQAFITYSLSQCCLDAPYIPRRVVVSWEKQGKKEGKKVRLRFRRLKWPLDGADIVRYKFA